MKKPCCWYLTLTAEDARTWACLEVVKLWGNYWSYKKGNVPRTAALELVSEPPRNTK